jgi:addiction module HigA family antidote
VVQEFETLKMFAAELARQIDVPVNRVTEIIIGQRRVTVDTAIRLAHRFSTSPEFCLNLQTLYKRPVAQEEIGKHVVKLACDCIGVRLVMDDEGLAPIPTREA